MLIIMIINQYAGCETSHWPHHQCYMMDVLWFVCLMASSSTLTAQRSIDELLDGAPVDVLTLLKSVSKNMTYDKLNRLHLHVPHRCVFIIKGCHCHANA